jgi:hypothetical protein
VYCNSARVARSAIQYRAVKCSAEISISVTSQCSGPRLRASYLQRSRRVRRDPLSDFEYIRTERGIWWWGVGVGRVGAGPPCLGSGACSSRGGFSVEHHYTTLHTREHLVHEACRVRLSGAECAPSKQNFCCTLISGAGAGVGVGVGVCGWVGVVVVTAGGCGCVGVGGCGRSDSMSGRGWGSVGRYRAVVWMWKLVASTVNNTTTLVS